MKVTFRNAVFLVVLAGTIFLGNSTAMASDPANVVETFEKGKEKIVDAINQAADLKKNLEKGKSKVADSIDLGASFKDKMDINTVTSEMLAKIPGIDSMLAEGITKYRDVKGAFSSIKDLLNVDGITPELLDKIKPFFQ